MASSQSDAKSPVSFAVSDLRQTWPKPLRCRPIVIIGAGGIVNDAHLPAYVKAGFPVAGIYDLDNTRAEALGQRWSLPVFASLDQAAAVDGAVFDLAIPPAAHLGLLAALPEQACVLLQKPMGRSLKEASAILATARQRRLTAAVNFQLRFAPMMLAITDATARELFGHLIDIEVHINVLTPWHLFPFLKDMPRVEIAVHSIHYLDLIRSFMGNPRSVMARTLGHPATDLAQTRTSAILDFDKDVRCTLSINHHHDFGPRFQDATIRFEGTEGAAVAKLGALLNYPRGMPDELWVTRHGQDWQAVPLLGTWFPDAFIGTMSNLQRVACGEPEALLTSVEDAWHSMALVEACFQSNAGAATPVPAQAEDVQ
jgi:predicted dehydrogenase